MSKKKKSQNTKKSAKHALQERENSLSLVREKLLSAISALKQADNFTLISHKQLGDYWQPNQPRAPFEEMFTIKQISEINIDIFFKKKSVVASKILAIVEAIKAAISTKKKEKAGKKKSDQTKDYSQLSDYYSIQYNNLAEKSKQIASISQKLFNSQDSALNKKTLNLLEKDLQKIDKIFSTKLAELGKLLTRSFL